MAPIILGGGRALFAGVRPDLRLIPREATVEPLATHLTYEVDNSHAG